MKKVICFLSMKKKCCISSTYQSQLRRDSLPVLGVPVESQESVQLRHHDSNTDVESEEVSQAIADGTKQLDFNQGVNIPCEKQSNAMGSLHLIYLGKSLDFFTLSPPPFFFPEVIM